MCLPQFAANGYLFANLSSLFEDSKAILLFYSPSKIDMTEMDNAKLSIAKVIVIHHKVVNLS